MADQLSIQIDTSRAEASLNTLGTAVDRFEQRLGKLTGNGAVDQLAAKLKAIDGLNPAFAKSVDEVTAKLGGQLAAKIAELQRNIETVKTTNIAQAATDIQKVQTALGALQSGNLSNIVGSLKAMGEQKTAFQALAAALGQSGTAIAAWGATMGGTAGQIAGFIGAASKVSSSLAEMGGASAIASAAFQQLAAASPVTMLAATAGVFITMAAAVSPITEKINGLVNSLNTLSKGDLGTRTLESLKSTAAATGAGFQNLIPQIQQFSVAANASGISTGQAAKTFRDLQTGMTGANLGSQQVQSAMTALTQILSKGKVQAQELVLQWGNAVPGGLAIAAKAMGTTEQGLLSMAEAGKVLPVDIVTKIGEEMARSFGPAANAGLRTTSRQLQLMADTFDYVKAAFGTGFNIGAMKGLADLIGGVNSVLVQMLPAINLIAAAFGELVGGSLSMVGNIFFGIGESIKWVVDGFKLVSTAWNQATASIAAGNGTWLELVTVGGIAGAALAAVAAAVMLVGPPLLAIGGAVVGFIASLSGMTLILGGVAAALGVFGYFSSAKEKLSATASAAEVTADAMSKVTQAFKENAMVGVETVAKMTSVESITKRLKDELKQAEDATIGFAKANRENDQAMSALDRTASKVKDSYASQKNEMQAAINRINDMNKAFGTQNDAMDTTRINRYTKALHEIGEEEKNYELRIRDRQQVMKEDNAARDAQIAKIKEAEAEDKKYGITLDETTRTIVQRAVQNGEDDKSAAKLAITIKQLTMTERERGDVVQAEIKKLEERAKFLKENIAIIDQGLASERKRLETLGLSKDVIDGLLHPTAKYTAELKNMLSITEQSAMTAKMGAESLGSYSAASAGAAAALEGINKQLAAATNPFEKARLELEKKKITDELATTAAKNLGDATEKSGEKASAASKAFSSIADVGKVMYDSISKGTPNVVAASSSIDKLSLSATQAAAPTTEIATAFTTMAAATETLGGNLDKVAASVGMTIEPMTQLAVVLPGVGETFNGMKTALETAGSAFPAIAAAVGALVETAPKAAPAIDLIAQSLTRSGEDSVKFGNGLTQGNTAMMAMQESIPKVTEAMITLLPQFEGIADKADKFTTLKDAVVAIVDPMTKLVEPSEKVAKAISDASAGLGTAATNSDTFKGAIEQLRPQVESLTTAMDKLTESAKQALAAATQAANAGGGGGGGGNVDAPSQREGGLSGNRMTTESVAISSFARAPKLSEGIANTSALASAIAGGGIPTILHPNEAVIPLSRGRTIPVEINGGSNQQSATAASTVADVMTNSVTTAISQAFDSLAAQLSTSSSSATPLWAEKLIENTAPTAGATTTNVPTTGGFAVNPNATSQSVSGGGQTTSSAPINVYVTVNATDAESFRKSKDQIAADTFRALREANRRNN